MTVPCDPTHHVRPAHALGDERGARLEPISATRENAWSLEAGPGSVAQARALVRDAVVGWGLSELADEAVLIVSELCTNAVRHGRPPVTLVLRASGRCLGGEVADRGESFAIPRPRASDEDEAGRGLQIVEHLTDEWGVDSGVHGVGKAVWWRKCR
ncbi:ATP-binding protein [Sphaerisporangium sp. NPDC005288]|uniref:ATP-binding protein n=1 Tax=Sphaerisporangium sp. NPDC005288 TaxID=3155114 RepID=UPI0033BE5FD3